MFLRILKRDLSRKKTMNLILLIFIILASMFVASGLNNVITAINGTDYFLDKAGVGDYAIITQGKGSFDRMESALKEESSARDYKIEKVYFGTKSNVFLPDGKEADMDNAIILQSIEEKQLSYFDSENNEINEIAPGHVYVSGRFMEEQNLKAGDKIKIRYHGSEVELSFDGKAKDALLGSSFMGNQRFLLNDADMKKLLSGKDVEKNYGGGIGYVTTNDETALSSAISQIPGILFEGGRSTFKMCYVMDMIVAFIVLILSVCLIIVSFVVLKFSITFTIMEEYREIGVMKAIGITSGKIRRLYIGKYLLLSLAGAAIGFAASIPFGNMLLKSVSDNMVLGNDMGFMTNLIGSGIVIVLILLFSYRCTRAAKKVSPLDAIRSGQTGERYKKKTVYRIGKSHVGPNLYLAFNDVLSSPKRFVTIIISFFICTLFVLMIVNTTATMESSNLVETFGTRSDLYVTEIDEGLENIANSTREEYMKNLRAKEDELKENGMPARLCVEVQYQYPVSFNKKDFSVTCQQGIETKIEDYTYTEGLAPQNEKEIAITAQVSDKIGAKIGDTVTIDFGEKKLDCKVTAYFQTMNRMGQIIRLHEDAPTNFSNVSNIMHTQINFTDSPDEDEIQNRKDRIKKLYDNDKVMNAAEYCADCIGVVDVMKAVQFLLLGITLIVVLLVTILLERSFIADERNEIAVLKAIGFRGRDIIRWHTFRFGVVSLVSVILAGLASIPMTKLCITPVFGMMGANDVDFKIEPLQVFLMYPGIVFLMTLVVAWVSAHSTRKITSRDTANIE